MKLHIGMGLEPMLVLLVGLNRNPQADAAYYRQASSNALLSGDISAAGDVLKAVSPLFGV
jgi:hypothetical protein